MFRGLGLVFRGLKSYPPNPYLSKTKPPSPKHVENRFNISDHTPEYGYGYGMRTRTSNLDFSRTRPRTRTRVRGCFPARTLSVLWNLKIFPYPFPSPYPIIRNLPYPVLESTNFLPYPYPYSVPVPCPRTRREIFIAISIHSSNLSLTKRIIISHKPHLSVTKLHHIGWRMEGN